MKRLIGCALWGAVGLALLAASGTARAAMSLTAAGTNAGFSLSTFADQFPNNGAVGPVGITFTSTGGVMVSSYAVGRNVVFATDTDGQHYSAAAVSATNYGFANPTGFANSGGNIYQALQQSGSVVRVDNNGNFVQNIATGMSSATGLITNPTNGHLFVSTPGVGTIWNVDPVAMTKTIFKTGVNFDGMTITADGSILYGANLSTGSIQGYDTTTGALVFDSGFIAGGIDGSALGTGSIAGNIFVNTNSGTLVEVNLATHAQTLLATGGSRGDFVTVDPNGTLLLTQTDSVLRLTAPPGGGFGVPEPSTMALLASGGLSLLVCRFRRRRLPG
jgi:hypothetical protein